MQYVLSHKINIIIHGFDYLDRDALQQLSTFFHTQNDIALQEWNHDKDYVHILFKAQPNSELSKFINAYKSSASSRLIKKEHPIIRKSLWKEFFWSRSFCLLNTGGVPIEVVKRYIESQGEKL